MQQEENAFSIELDEQIAEGIYANLVIINHSNTEFVLDFVNMMPGLPKAKVKSRLILTPQHAKRLLGALAENIRIYEQNNGHIADVESPQVPAHFGTQGKA